MKAFPPVGVLGLVGMFTLQVALFCLITWTIGLTGYERSLVWQRSQRFISDRRLATVGAKT